MLATSSSGGGKGSTYSSALSPLLQSQRQDWNVNQPYKPLPHPAEAFTQGGFGPLSPVQPMPIDVLREDGRPDTRRMQYPVGWNLPVGTPGSEGIKLATFATLRAVADMYSVARSAVNKRKGEILGLKWDIVPTSEAEQAMQGDDDARADFEKRRAQVVEFFQHPDSDRAKYPSFKKWLSALLEDRFVCDAVAIRLRPPRRKGAGPLGSNLASLDLVDGTTIRPLLDLQGATPKTPAVAYQQYLWGVPRVDLLSVITDADVELLDEDPVEEYRADQLIYMRDEVRDWTPYGFSLVEKALVPISIGLARQQYQNDYFQEGSIPGQFITPGPDISTPAQIRQLQDALNAMAGDIGNKHRIIVLPPGSKAEPQKPHPLADQFDEWIISQVAMPFGLTPMDLGVTPRVSAVQSPSESRQLSEINTDAGSQTRVEPVCEDLKNSIFDFVIQEIFGQRDMEWSWGLTQRGDNKDDEISQHITLVTNGLESIDQALVELGKTPWGLPETSVPMVLTATGPVPLAAVAAEHAPAPGDAPDQPGQPAEQLEDDDLTTPAHEAARALPTTPGSPDKPAGKDDGPADGGDTAKAIGAELQILERYLRKGRPPGEFRTTLLPAEALEAAEAELPKGVAAAVSAAAAKTATARRHARRAAHLAAAMTRVAGRLGQLVHGHRTGRLSMPQALDDGVRVMADGYTAAMQAGSSDAAADHQVDTIDLSAQAADRAEAQRGFLARLIKDYTGLSTAQLAARLNLYGNTLNGAYNAGYGQTMLATGQSYEIIWHLGAAEHCELCVERDGKVFTFKSLPGWPGDGDFGGADALCLGGPNCHCSLEYRQGGRALAEGGNTQRPDSVAYYRQQLIDITAARQAAAAERADFVDSLPDELNPVDFTSAQGRALARDQLRQVVADLVNARIRQSGGYPGITVEPQDIPASIIAQLLPEESRGAELDLPQPLPRINLAQAVAQMFTKAAQALPGEVLTQLMTDTVNDLTKARGHSLSPRSGMISLDLPEGLIEPVPGGVADHHITLVYLGPDVDDDALEEACARARAAAAAVPGPLAGTLQGIDSFEPSASSDGLRPVFAPVALPGVEQLRALLEDLSASEHTTYHPHVTLAYVGPDETRPAPLPRIPVEFTHLSVHRGDDVIRIPLGGSR